MGIVLITLAIHRWIVEVYLADSFDGAGRAVDAYDTYRNLGVGLFWGISW